jgi:hypothetical protein
VVIETYALPPAPSQPGVAGSCPLPSGGSNGGATSGGSPGTGTTTVSVHHSGRAIFGRLRVRLPRHALRPSASFLLKIALRPAQRGRAGYRYRLELTRLRCADGATEIAIDFGNRDVTMSCKAHTKRLHGLIRLASRYVVHVRATSVRGHRRMALGAIYSLALQAR